MAGFQPGSFGIGSNHSANCATTTAILTRCLCIQVILKCFRKIASFFLEQNKLCKFLKWHTKILRRQQLHQKRFTVYVPEGTPLNSFY